MTRPTNGCGASTADPVPPLVRRIQERSSRRRAVADSRGLSPGRRSTLIVVSVNLLAMVAAGLVVPLSSGYSPVLAWACAACVMISTGITGRFRTRMVPDFVGQVHKVANAVLVGVAIPFGLLALRGSRVRLSSFLILTATLFCASMAADWISAVLVRKLSTSGRLRSRALLIGSGRLAKELAVELELRREYGVDIVETIDLYQLASGSSDVVDDTADLLLTSVEKAGADRLIIAATDIGVDEGRCIVSAARAAAEMGLPTFVVPHLYELGMGLDSMSPDRARGYPLVRVQRSAHPQIALKLKRAIDVLVSSTALAALSPVLLLAALAVKATSSGPVLFRQPRVGQGGKVFDMLKFRSMAVSENEHAERHSQHRVTLVGKVLRSTSFDELPQLWNILRGDMTLVGPRPERVAFVEEGLMLHDGYADRHRMPMGLTGLAQVAGLRGEDTSVVERVKFDNLYIDQWSLGLDAQIVVKTFFAILLQTRYRRRHRELSEAIEMMVGTSDRGRLVTIDLRASEEYQVVDSAGAGMLVQDHERRSSS